MYQSINNGNISGQLRKDQNGNVIDSLTYNYYTLNGNKVQNRLYSVNDTVRSVAYTDDIDDEGVFNDATNSVNVMNNYSYDEIGNLKKDSIEGIKDIEWTVSGKVKSITRYTGYFKVSGVDTIYPSDLMFNYDALGNRVSKTEMKRDTFGLRPPIEWITTYYVRDPKGLVMGVYVDKKDTATMTESFTVVERDIYGSSLVGIDKDSFQLIGSGHGLMLFMDSTWASDRILGRKYYEGANHLGNVLSVFTDRKMPIDSNADGIIDYYLPEVVSANDYSAFGAPLYGRTFNSPNYRFGFNGQEKDNEVAGVGNINTAAFWEYDGRLGRRWNVDPKPIPSFSSYSCFKDNPIGYNDPLGDSVWVFATTLPMSDGKLKTVLGVATHTFIIVKTNDNKIHYYVYGPKSDKNGDISYIGGSSLERSNYQQDGDILSGKDVKNLKAKILVPAPKGQTSDEFDQAVIKTAESFGDNPNIKYKVITASDLSGNCNSSVSTILSKAGVCKEDIKLIDKKIPGINAGFGAVKPWTKEEQDKAVKDDDKKAEMIKRGIDAMPKQ